MSSRETNFKHHLELLSLNSPQSRLFWWAFLTFSIFVVPYHWLEDLSLYKTIGWESAPSIGLTRAYWLLIHGNPDAAVAMNSLILVVLVVGLPLLAVDALQLMRSSSREH